MNITLFGASGAIGQLVIQKAIQNGDRVIAYVRREDSISISHKRLKIIIGELSNERKMEEAIEDADVVISTLGPALDNSRKVKSLPIASGHKMIIHVMEKMNIKRLITLGTPTVKAKEDKKQLITVLPGIMAKMLFPTGYQEMKEIEQLVKQSTLDWTVVRIINPNLKQSGKGYNISLGNTNGKMGVSRDNVAQCMYDIAQRNTYQKQMPIVFNK
ncbi:NAD(P)H-binding protein [Psychrobacillus vulpis]|uniref:NAD-dependent epimerase/dehydratase family protein n=1 Tax=Psychrobacillus vulpis TaxID=2325572 RepID=A0A544TWF7_9BACI|nr:NAD(P)H-binding protein [Psychrobacillus vulpis]TQR21751.1 NAD-dependent epimerase/dehydratase family protein [Psychrobacillus vulpis]